jgi:hypothetical protein
MVSRAGRYAITAPAPLGAPAENEAQKIDAARARAALDRARGLGTGRDQRHESTRCAGLERARIGL